MSCLWLLSWVHERDYLRSMPSVTNLPIAHLASTAILGRYKSKRISIVLICVATGTVLLYC